MHGHLSRAFIFSLTCCAALIVPTAANAASPHSWTERVPFSIPDGGRPTVDSGRLSTLLPHRATVTVRSRRLDASDRRTVTLNTAALTHPGGGTSIGRPFTRFGVDKARFGSGHVAVIGYWFAEMLPGEEPGPGEAGPPPSPISTLAVFNATTGALVRQQDLDSATNGAEFLAGTPGIVRPTTPPRFEATGELQDIVDGTALPIVTPIDQPTLGGPLIVTYPDTRTSRWRKDSAGILDGGYGTIRATRWQTGQRAWDISTTAIARAALMRSKTPGMQIALTDDGLPILAAGTRHGDVRPVVVSSNGHLARIGRRIDGISGFRTVTRDGRAIVEVFGTRKVGAKARECGGVWLTNTSGTRGRRLPNATRDKNLIGWNHGSAVWIADTSDDDQVIVRAETDLNTRKLSKSDLPRCR